MKIVGAVFGFIILVVVFVVWIKAYRKIKGEDESFSSMGKRKSGAQKDSLEDFIASYKRGEVAIGADAPASVKPAAEPSSRPATATATATAAAPVRRETFISGPIKLAYLTCKTGLRDHHVFAHVRLSALSGGAIDPALTGSGVDLLICNTSMAPVAAVDVIDAGNAVASTAKSAHLKALNIRYLRLSAKSLPRPDEWNALLYKM
jgi:hypothetical protein